MDVPSFWLWLLSPSQAQEVHDEYDIAVKGTTPVQREKKLNELISRLGMIESGEPGWEDFGDWCLKTVATTFASSLRNVELVKAEDASGPGMLAASNLARTDSWLRLAEVLGVEQAIFLLYNRPELDERAYKEATSKLVAQGGKAVFLITRDNVLEMGKEGELSWVRDICQKSGAVVFRLTAKYLATMLGKLRNPQKHDAVEKSFGGFVNTYLTSYLKGFMGKAAPAVSAGGPAEAAVVNFPTTECYGELDIDGKRRFALRIFLKKVGPGQRKELCEAVLLKNQAYNILESGIANARRQHIENQFEQAREDGTPMSRSECEPPPEMSFEVEWTPDQLATVLHDKEKYTDLTKSQKKSIKTAVHRVRGLVKFTHDNCGLVSEPAENGARRSLIPLRLRKSGQP